MGFVSDSGRRLCQIRCNQDAPFQIRSIRCVSSFQIRFATFQIRLILSFLLVQIRFISSCYVSDSLQECVSVRFRFVSIAGADRLKRRGRDESATNAGRGVRRIWDERDERVRGKARAIASDGPGRKSRARGDGLLPREADAPRAAEVDAEGAPADDVAAEDEPRETHVQARGDVVAPRRVVQLDNARVIDHGHRPV